MLTTMEIESKECSLCKQSKPIDLFKKSRGGRGVYCKSCAVLVTKKWREDNREKFLSLAWDRTLRVRFGISSKNYSDIFDYQGGVCAICKNVNRDGNRLAVDHCHKSGLIRGLLCKRCNLAIGFLDDNTDIIQSAASYLLYSQKAVAEIIGNPIKPPIVRHSERVSNWRRTKKS